MLRYHGGKWRIAPWVIGHFPPHNQYIEPFGGAASVLLRKPRSRLEVYNDLDGELVNLFRVARDQGEALVQAVTLTPYARAEFQAARAPSDDPVEQARRTLLRSAMGFGSNAHNRATGFRGRHRVQSQNPVHDWRHFPEPLGAIIERLRGVVIEHANAFTLIDTYDAPETLFYIDPPYLFETRSDGEADYRFELDEADHIALAERLHTIEGAAVVSGYPSPLYDALYAGWHRFERAARSDGAHARTEAIWLSPKCGAHDLFSPTHNHRAATNGVI